MGDIGYGFKVWLTFKGQPLMGSGRYRLLKSISKTRSLKLSAEALGITTRTAYNYISKMESRLGKKIVDTFKGGSDGGYSELTALGKALVGRYEKLEARI